MGLGTDGRMGFLPAGRYWEIVSLANNGALGFKRCSLTGRWTLWTPGPICAPSLLVVSTVKVVSAARHDLAARPCIHRFYY